MKEYTTIAQRAQAEFIERKSQFIGVVAPVSTEEEAQALIAEVRAAHRDATHNTFAYILNNGIKRCSDDGEPQGTAGQPMLGVFQKEGVTNVCCVVTRYFGGMLLGAGGLVRAYTQSAKNALDAAGVSTVRRWLELAVECPYSFLERVKRACAAQNGIVGEIEYAAGVTVHALLPEERAEAFCTQMTELSAGDFAAVELGEVFRSVPVER